MSKRFGRQQKRKLREQKLKLAEQVEQLQRRVDIEVSESRGAREVAGLVDRVFGEGSIFGEPACWELRRNQSVRYLHHMASLPRSRGMPADRLNLVTCDGVSIDPRDAKHFHITASGQCLGYACTFEALQLTPRAVMIEMITEELAPLVLSAWKQQGRFL